MLPSAIPRSWTGTRLVALALVLGGLLAGVAARRENDGPAPVRNVILIVVDTLRADHLSLYGYPRQTSPNLDRLARSAVVFEHARSQAPCTFPSVNSILTSRHPMAFMGQLSGAMRIPEGVPSLAEILGGHGFLSHAVSASEVVRVTPSRLNPSGGFGRGFETFDETCLNGPASCVNRGVFDLLGDRTASTFLYVHYMDPHGPYAPPPGHVRRWATGTVRNPYVASADPVVITKQVLRGPGGRALRSLHPDERQYLIDLYDDEITFWDAQLARLFAKLEARGVLHDTIVVLAADHGESFGLHGTLAHCRTLFEAETRVPLVMWIPGVAGHRIAAPVENLDIVPTILDYLGIAPPEVDGVSLRSLVEGRSGPPRRFGHSFHVWLRSASDARHKAILDVRSGDLQVFDLVADPGERTNLVGEDGAAGAAVAELRFELERWTAKHEGARGTAWTANAAGAVVDRLRSLGYVH